jgi:hypothetical protein
MTKNKCKQKYDTNVDTLIITLHFSPVKNYNTVCRAQSKQSANFFSSRRNGDSPTPFAAGECAPPSFGSKGGAHSLAGEGLGESQFRRRDIHCGAHIYVSTL